MGTFWYLFLFGPYNLYFTNVNWIYSLGGDPFQRQIGWEWFRQEPWTFPIGQIYSYGFPSGTSISFLDSIPLMAIPFKILSPFLKQHFQYLGLWDLLSVIGQFFFCFLILDEYKTPFLEKLIGGSLLVSSSIFIFRFFGHDSLTAQWIILAAIWLSIVEYRRPVWRGAWIVLFAVAILVHIYFVAMIFPIWGVSLYFHRKRAQRATYIFVEILLVMLVLMILGSCLGLFKMGLSNLSAMGYGNYSWNLNGFINPLESSAFFQSMTTGTVGQYEGFSYLGIGNLILIIIGLVLYLTQTPPVGRKSFFYPFIIISTLYIIFALSNKAYMNSMLLWDIHLPDSLFNFFAMFRSSGRFVWPVFYFLVLFGMLSSIRNLRSPWIFLLMILFLQVIELEPLYSAKHSAGFIDYHSPLQSDFWAASAKTNKHIVFIPGDKPSNYEPIALYARENKMTLNTGYFARSDQKAINNYADQALEEIKNGHPDSETIYIFWKDDMPDLIDTSGIQGKICQVDNYQIFLSPQNQIQNENVNLSDYCTFLK